MSKQSFSKWSSYVCIILRLRNLYSGEIQTATIAQMLLSGFFVTQILREINFGESRSSETAVFAIFRALNFVNLVNIRFQKVQIFIFKKPYIYVLKW